MKEKIKVTAVVMFFGVIFSGILVAYKLVNTIIPSFDGGSASVFDYLLIVTVTVSMVLKLAVGSMGLRAVSKKTSPPDMQKMLKTSGKLAVVLVLIGVLNIIFNVVNGQVVFVIEVFDIATDILLGFVYILASASVRVKQRISSDFRLQNKKINGWIYEKSNPTVFCFCNFSFRVVWADNIRLHGESPFPVREDSFN